MCLLGVPKTKFYILTPFPPKTQIFVQFLTGLGKFRVKKALTMGMLICKLPFIVIDSPGKLYSCKYTRLVGLHLRSCRTPYSLNSHGGTAA